MRDRPRLLLRRHRHYLRKGDHAYNIGEKLSSGSPEVNAALSRQVRHKQIGQNMRVKEVRISDTDRFVISHNPEAAERDKVKTEATWTASACCAAPTRT